MDARKARVWWRVSYDGLRRVMIVAVAAAVAFVQAYEYLFPLGYGWIYDYGAGLETIPVHRALVSQQVMGGLLAPFVAGGVDRLSFFGNADSPLLFSTWLFVFFSPPIATGVHMFLQCFVGSVWAGLLCRDRLKLGASISAVAAILYASFSYPVFGFLFNAALIPFLAWFLTVPRARSVGLLVLVGLGASFLTSLSQGFPFMALFIALWLPIVGRASILATVRTLAAMTAGYCVGKVPTLLAILNSVPRSQRSGELRYDSLVDTPILYTESDFLFSDRHMWTYTQAVPTFFAALCVVFLVVGFVERRRGRLDAGEVDRTDALFKSILRVAVVYVILASGALVPVRNLLAPAVPWLGSINMVRTITASGALLNTLIVAYGLVIVQLAVGQRTLAMSLMGIAAAFCWTVRHSWTLPTEFGLLLVVLAASAIGAAWWSRRQDTKGLGRLGRVPVGVVVVFPTAVLAVFYACVAPKVLLAPLRSAPQSGYARYYIPAIREIEGSDRTLHRYASVLPLQPANALFNGVEPLDGWANLYSAEFRQFWLAMLGPLLENLPDERSIFGTDDRAPQDHYLFLGTGAFLRTDLDASMDIDRRFNMNLLSLMNVAYVLSYYPLSSKYLAEVHVPARPLERMSWDYATGRESRMRDNTVGWPSVAKGLMSAIGGPLGAADHVYAYRNVCVLARAFSVERLERHGSDSDVLKTLTKASPVDLMRTAHMLSKDAPPLADKLVPASLRLSRYRAGEIALDAMSSGAALIVVANTWIPGWKVYVNGRDAPLLRVNHTQIGVHLPVPGTFQVRLAYEPPYRRLASLLAAPAQLVAGGHRANPSSRQLSLGDLPPVCGSPNVRE
jgi:hypothetical protein